MLEFDLERDELRPVAVYVHAHEIWSITPSPTDPGAFVTVHNEGALWPVSEVLSAWSGVVVVSQETS